MHLHRIVLLGDKDHGKSTFIGSMLMLTKSVSSDRINEARRISKELGRKFEPGFILDSFSEEREKAMTIDTTRAQLSYKKVGFELIDVPGHEELITNMLTGASSASIAVLVVSAKKGEGISEQTKRHLLVAMMLGISNVVIAINKMDAVGYNSNAFDSIKSSLSEFINNAQKSLGAVRTDFVPISAYNGDNLIRNSKNMRWYKGKPLAEILSRDAMEKCKDEKGGILRVIVQGAMPGGGFACKVVAGTLSKGEKVISVPGGTECIVNKIVSAGKVMVHASAGSSPVLSLSSTKGIKRGSVICRAGDKPMVAKSIDALVFFSEIPKNASMRLNGIETRCNITISKELDINDGNLKKGNAKPLGIFSAHINCSKPIVVEKYNKVNELGRFTIYEGGKFAGLGIVT
ncbi:MAG: GTP-binding protein [Candidatus Micrarchaeaceae archaeon]